MPWAEDSQLVRGSVDGFNLAIGEPHFLREVFQPYYPRHYPADLSYPDSQPSEELARELRILHPGHHVVVTVGAKQALHAAMYALAPEGNKVLAHRSPSWPTYSTIAEYAGLMLVDQHWDGPRSVVLRCNTTPNNPDGSESPEMCDVWDAAYAHSVYGWTGMEPPHRISVWSAGKMLGAPGVRVGWLVTLEERLAERARQYVEQTTSGVPTISQHHVAATLRNTAHNREQLYDAARATLTFNQAEAMRIFEPMWCDEMYTRGMFAWVNPRHAGWFSDMCRGAGVRVVDGNACGGKLGWFRLSLGNNYLTTKAAVDTLLAYVKTQKEQP